MKKRELATRLTTRRLVSVSVLTLVISSLVVCSSSLLGGLLSSMGRVTRVLGWESLSSALRFWLVQET